MKEITTEEALVFLRPLIDENMFYVNIGIVFFGLGVLSTVMCIIWDSKTTLRGFSEKIAYAILLCSIFTAGFGCYLSCVYGYQVWKTKKFPVAQYRSYQRDIGNVGGGL